MVFIGLPCRLTVKRNNMLHIFDTTDKVLDALAQFFVDTAKKAIESNGKFSVALSGGSSPKALYELLASKYEYKLDWSKVHFFFGDERNVPNTHPDSNSLMATRALFGPLNIDDTHIYAVDTSVSPEEAAKCYIAEINDFFEGKQPVFDLVLLGLGDNSHTASLFPHTPVLHDDSVSVKSVFLENQQVYRITFTAPLINLAANIAFLVYGEAKAEAVHHVLEDAANIEEYPAQLIRKDKVEWFLDTDAASMLKNK
jgi:6-phosphogluconolactonase